MYEDLWCLNTFEYIALVDSCGRILKRLLKLGADLRSLQSVLRSDAEFGKIQAVRTHVSPLGFNPVSGLLFCEVTAEGSGPLVIRCLSKKV